MADSQATSCPDDARLRDFLDGRLPVQQMDRLAQHLETCESCQQRLEQIDDSDPSVDRWSTPEGEIPYAQETQCERAIGAAADSGTKPDLPMPRKAPPKQLGEYELLEPLGEGGMGAVYRARHVRLGSICAIKLLHPQRQADRATIERFEREMVALGKLDHPHIVRAIDAGEDQGIHYLVMEFVRGVDLSKILQRRKQLSVADACEATRQAALGLAYVHRHGRVHRDVKPSNFMLTAEGNIKLLDLGLAQVEGVEIDEKTLSDAEMELPALGELTRTHQIMGTIEYMAPEQASDTHTVDFRADIYSLGCTLYKLLSGQSPFASTGEVSQLSQVLAHVQTPAPPIQTFRHDVPDELARLIEQMLAKQPDGRPRSADKIAYELEPFCKRADLIDLMRAPVVHAASGGDREPVAAKSPFGPAPSAKKPFPWVSAILTLCAIVMALGGMALYGMYASMDSNNFYVRVYTSEADSKLRDFPAYLVDRDTGRRVQQILPGDYEIPRGTYYIESPADSPLDFGSKTGPDSTFSLAANQSVQLRIEAKTTPFELPGESGGARTGRTEAPRADIAAKPIGPPVELLSLLDADRDFQNDAWQLAEGALVGNNYRPSIIQIPYHPSDHYRLEATVERLAGTESMMIALPAGNAPVIISIDGWPNNGFYAGIYRLNDRNPTNQPAAIVSRGQKLHVGKPARLAVTMKHDGGRANVYLEIDQQPVFSWSGNVSDTGDGEWMYTHEPTALALAKFRAPFRVSELRVVPFAEGGETIEFADPARHKQLAAAQRAIWKGGQVTLQPVPTPPSEDGLPVAENPVIVANRLSQLPADPRITAIDMRRSDWIDDRGLALFAGLDTLESLSLSGTPVTAAGLEQLGSLPALRQLVLTGSGVSDQDWPADKTLAWNLPALQRLDLSANRLGDGIVATLGPLTSLQELNLADTRVSGAGLAALNELQNLTTLRLDHTAITTADLEQLPPLANLGRLSLRNTELADLAWLTSERFPQLREVNLFNTESSAEQIASARKQLPEARLLAGDEPLALAPLIDTPRDTLAGAWSNTAAQLVKQEGHMAKLALPIVLPEEFDLTVDITKLSGANAPVFALPLPDGTLVVVGFDHWPDLGGYTILHGIDGLNEQESRVKTKMVTFPKGVTEPVQIAIHVRRHDGEIEIVAERNGEVVIQWQGDPLRLYPDMHWFSPDRLRPTIKVFNGHYKFDRLTITPVSGRIAHYDTSPRLNGPDREVAQWLLAHGGKVVVQPGIAPNPNASIESLDQLPSAPFWVEDLTAGAGVELPREILASIGKLTHLENLRLPNARFDNADLELLTGLDSVKRAYCSDSNLNDEGLRHLSRLINLADLHVSNTEVTGAGIESLAGHRQLAFLTAKVSSLDDRAAQTAATLPRLVYLILATSQVSETGLEALQGKPTLSQLFLGQCDNLRDADMANLITLPNLKVLDLTNGQLGPQACYSLGLMSSLERLRMYNNPIGNEGIKRLEKLANLIELHAGGMQITDEAMATIGKFQKLENLRLDRNPNITDRSIETIVTLKKLRELYLVGSGISRSGVERLRQALPQCTITSQHDAPTERRLYYRDRGVTDESLELALEGEGPIVELQLGGQGITDMSLPLIASLPELRSLDLWSTAITNEGVEILAKSNSLRRLEFWHMPQITAEVTEPMAKIPNLAAITFKHTGVYGPGLERLFDTKVASIHFGSSKLDSAMFEQYIVPFGHLDNLDLAGAAITDADIAKIVPLGVSNFLHLGYNKNVYGPGLISIADMPQLNQLNLDHSAVDDAGLAYLSGADKLRKLILVRTDISDASVETLATLTGLVELDLTDTQFTAEGVAALRERLPHTTIHANHLNSPAATGNYPPAHGKKVAASGWKSSFSPDGNKLVYGVGFGDGMEIVDLETGAKRKIDIRAKDPTWSPRGDWIAFIHEPFYDSGRGEVWVVKPDGSDARKIAAGFYPFWIDGGNTLVFYSQALPGLVSVQIDTEVSLQPFYRDLPTLFADATDDGEHIAYVHEGHLLVVNRGTRAVEYDLPVQEAGTGLAEFSPDGKSAAFSFFEGEQMGIWLCLWQDHVYSQLYKGDYQTPTWSPTGDRLAFDYNRFGKPQERELWIAPVLIKPAAKP